MKHISTFLFLFWSVTTLSNNPYQLKNEEVDFSEIDKIEQMVHQNPELNLSTLSEDSPELVEKLVSESNMSSSAFLKDSDTLIPPFWWGFCLGIWGVIIVLILSDKDKNAVNTAFKGCLVWA